MSNTLQEYLGYTGSIEHDLEDGILYGKILFINDLVNYEGNTLPELQTAFEAAVDHYLELCKETATQPNKPMTGSFNVRIGEENHRRLAMEAAKRGETINALVKSAVEEMFVGKPPQHVTHKHEYVLKIQTATEAESFFETRGDTPWPIASQRAKGSVSLPN